MQVKDVSWKMGSDEYEVFETDYFIHTYKKFLIEDSKHFTNCLLFALLLFAFISFNLWIPALIATFLLALTIGKLRTNKLLKEKFRDKKLVKVST